MTNVLLVHATSAYIYRDSTVMFLGMNLAFFLNQTTRFCVPLFLLLSGFSLGRKGTFPSHGTFLRGRAVRVLAPYLFWLLVYEGWNCGLNLRAWLNQVRNLNWLLGAILTGQTAPHLYFIPLLFQFYLLLPLLRRWVDKRPVRSVVCSLAATLLMQGFHCLQGLGLLPASGALDWLNRLFVGWVFYFVAGLALARRDTEALCRRCGAVAGRLTLAGSAVLILYALSSRITGLLDAIRPSLTGITLLVFFWGAGAWEKLKRVPNLSACNRFLAAHSLGMYYNHVLVLCILRYVTLTQRGMTGMGLLFIGTFLGAAVMDVCTEKLLGLLRCFYQKAKKETGYFS